MTSLREVRASVSVQEPEALRASALDLLVTRRQQPPSAAIITTTVDSAPPGRVTDDPSLKSTWAHRAWVACGCASVLATLAKSGIAAAAAAHGDATWVECLLAGGLGYLAADLGSGVYHWAIDNYGDAGTPFFGPQIEAFQGHHRWPWTITRREFANNLQALARATAFLLLPVDLLPGEPGLHAFAGTFLGCLMFSQQFHAWSHGTKSRLPPAVVALQDAGLLVPRAMHMAHHRPPYNNNYCIVSGVWNRLLDEANVFEALEMLVFFRFGVRPRCWSEPTLEWTEEVDDRLPS
ncbi:Fatty acid desaturase 4 [Nymphaea thermarum]|nr:Fatty acid desaturase 4 [Nymphaea thermarum]